MYIAILFTLCAFLAVALGVLNWRIAKIDVRCKACSDAIDIVGQANESAYAEIAQTNSNAQELAKRLDKVERTPIQSKQPVISKRWSETRDELQGKPFRARTKPQEDTAE